MPISNKNRCVKVLALGCLTLFETMPVFSNDASIINNGRYGPMPYNMEKGEESPLQLVKETLDFVFGRKETRVKMKFILRNTKNETISQMTAFPDLTLGWKKHGEEFEKMTKEEREKRSDRDEHFFHELPYSPVRDDFGFSEDFSGILMDLETFVNGNKVPSELVYGRIKVNRDGDWLPTSDNDAAG